MDRKIKKTRLEEKVGGGCRDWLWGLNPPPGPAKSMVSPPGKNSEYAPCVYIILFIMLSFNILMENINT